MKEVVARKRLCAAAIAGLLAWGAPALGTMRQWTGGNGQWDNSLAWSPTGAPVHNDGVIIGQAGAAVTYVNSLGESQVFPIFTINASGTAASLSQAQQTLRVGQIMIGDAGKGSISQSGGRLSVENPLGITLGGSSGGEGIYTLSGNAQLDVTAYLSVGELGKGTFTVNSGALSLSGGAIAIAANSGSTGTFTLTGGSVYSDDLQMSTFGGVAAFNQSGGAVQINHELALGDVTGTSGGPATYTQAGGSVTTAAMSIGRSALFKRSGGTLTTGSLTIDLAGGKLDLTNRSMVVDYDGATPLATLKGYIASAYQGGAWSGAGITSSLGNSQLLIGYGEASSLLGLTSGQSATWNGVSVDATSVLLSYALVGDTNLDGSVNFLDLTALAASYGSAGATWAQGDFNYDGAVNFLDLTALAANYGGALPGEAVAGLPVGAVIVPEPSIPMSLLVAAAVFLASRRRKVTPISQAE